jgi:hypothetical protein
VYNLDPGGMSRTRLRQVNGLNGLADGSPMAHPSDPILLFLFLLIFRENPVMQLFLTEIMQY